MRATFSTGGEEGGRLRRRHPLRSCRPFVVERGTTLRPNSLKSRRRRGPDGRRTPARRRHHEHDKPSWGVGRGSGKAL